MAWKQYPSAEGRGDENGSVEELIGGTWFQIKEGGILRVVNGTVDGNNDFTANGESPTFPESWYLSGESTAPDTSDGTVVYTSPDVSIYNYFNFSIKTAPNTGLKIQLSLDGTTWETADTVRQAAIKGSTLAILTGTDLMTATTGNYVWRGKTKLIRVVQVGAGTAMKIIFAHGNE